MFWSEVEDGPVSGLRYGGHKVTLAERSIPIVQHRVIVRKVGRSIKYKLYAFTIPSGKLVAYDFNSLMYLIKLLPKRKK